ncbi:hypothetical protein nbrc107696_24440 [Gordonia spumicola]|uniref:Uncharacterized protein n=1 Tax=Gordonia spumicola TaxID=589161 RepID=A0A7I9V9C9_9ACTN|nr:hypothetical protein nbrc107696_24440 [Gordonia spumicola]
MSEFERIVGELDVRHVVHLLRRLSGSIVATILVHYVSYHNDLDYVFDNVGLPVVARVPRLKKAEARLGSDVQMVIHGDDVGPCRILGRPDRYFDGRLDPIDLFQYSLEYEFLG